MDHKKLNEIPFAAANFKPVYTSGTYDYCFTTCNNAFIKLFGGDVTGMFFSNLPGNLKDLFCKVVKNIENKVSRFSFFAGGGREYDVWLSDSGGAYGVFIIDKPASSLTDKELQNILNLLPAGVLTADANGKITYINPAAQMLSGLDENAAGKSVADVLNLSPKDGGKQVDIISEPELNGKFVLTKKGGGTVDIELLKKTLDGKNASVVYISDVSRQAKLEREVSYLTYHDRLTGLYNRVYFEKALKEFDKECYCPVSIIMGDVNGLKMINDVFGQQQGDLMLVTVANILSLACRESDVIARYGGDEFVVIMPNTPLEEAARICKNISNVCQSKTIDNHKISVSLGYACKSNASESMSSILNVAEDFMCRHKLLESNSYRSSFLSSLKSMLFERSFETEEHAMRLTGLCAEAGRLMGLSQNDMNDLELLCMLHDIGKIGVSDQVLLKPGKLTEEEWVEMRKHSIIGYRIARSTPELAHIANYILCHHERYDGTGYPQGLKGDEIPLLSRILSVADAYDAMVNDRYYRKAMSHEYAVAELKRCSGTQFDPEVVKVFLQILEKKSSKASA